MTGPPSRRTHVLDAVAYAGMFVFGIVMALLGAVMPVVSRRLALGLDDVGTLFLVTNAAMLAASLVVGPAIDRFGMKAPLALGGLLVAAALIVIANAGRMEDLLVAVACLGFGGGALNASTNTLVADLHEDPEKKAAALNVLGVFFGFGALLLPFSIGALLSSVGLRGVLTATAALCAAAGLAAAVPPFPAPKQAHGWPLADMRRFAGTPLVLSLAFLLFFQSGNEFVLGGYLATFLTQELATPVGQASYLLAAYWAAIMVSRVLLSRVLLHFGAYRIVLGGALVAAAAAGALAAARDLPIAIAALLITGFALAGIFPTVLGVAGSVFRDRSGTVFGILFTVALTGGMTMPWLAGHLAASAGLRAVFVLAAGNFVAIALLNALTHRARAVARSGSVLAGIVAAALAPIGSASCRTSDIEAKAPIVQPGAPGRPSRVIGAAEAADVSQVRHTPADVRFMQGMIGHHAQALEMTALVASRSASEDLRKLAMRIEVSQADEIAMMQQWLKQRGQRLPDPHAHHAPGATLMPGMLTAEEMARLSEAKGTAFDRLFLELMIKHHDGALVMVKELFSAPGAGQEPDMFSFASDVEADQRMEIERMGAMLVRMRERQQ